MPTTAGALRSCLVLAAIFALALKGADRLPSLLSGAPQGARVYWTVEAAETGTGTRIWLPASVPSSIAWPPSRIDAWPLPPLSVAVHFAPRGDRGSGLLLVESLSSPAAPPDALLPPVKVLITVPDVPLGRHRATMTRALAPDGQLLHDLSWDQGGRRLVIRYAGPVEDLLSVAGSLERNHP